MEKTGISHSSCPVDPHFIRLVLPTSLPQKGVKCSITFGLVCVKRGYLGGNSGQLLCAHTILQFKVKTFMDFF